MSFPPGSGYDPPALASLDAFLSLDVRIGTIVSAEFLKGARRPAFALRIDFGDLGTKTGSAEVTDLYEPGELVGLQVAAVVNLPPQQVAGLVCNVMVLAADNGRGEHTLIIPEQPLPDGARVGLMASPPPLRPKAELMDAARIARTLSRIAHEIVERHPDMKGLALVGVRSRGVPLARRLAKMLADAQGTAPLLGALDITLYRDDFTTIAAQPVTKGTDIPFSIDGRTVVVVDDVLFTGRTVRAALDELIDFGRPARIELAVLIDRGHRELPIRADYVGKTITTARDQVVQVLLTEEDGKDGVMLLERGTEGKPRKAGLPRERPFSQASQDSRSQIKEAKPLTALSAPASAGHRAPRPVATSRPSSTPPTPCKEILDRPIKKVPTLRGKHRGEPLLRSLHPHPRLLRDGGADPLRRQPLHQPPPLERLQGREPPRHRQEPRGHEPRRDRDPALARRGPRTSWPATAASRIVNAGDGAHEHPTQALLDAFTLRQRKGRLEGPQGRDRGRHPALAGRALEPLAPHEDGGRGHALRPAHPDPAGHRGARAA